MFNDQDKLQIQQGRQLSMQSEDDQNEEQVQKKHQQLIYKISYQDNPESQQGRKYKYSKQTLQPFLYFYKLLAFKPCDRVHRNQLILNIPDTIIFNDGDNPIMWMYTNQRGEVTRMDNVPYFQITNKFCDGAFDKELVAVLKKPTYGYGGPNGNQVKVVSASQIKTVLSIVLAGRNQISVIQKFVKSGSVKPSIVRTCWRSSGNNESWTLNSNYQYTSKAKVPEISKFIVNTKLSKGFRAIKNVSQKFTAETLKYVKNIVDFISRNLKVRFKQFVCDFIKDEGGNWWFINVKAFILEGQEKVNIKPITMHDDEISEQGQGKKNLQTYTKCKKCKYCYKIVAEHLMTHKLTLMMILQCDQHLIRLGKSFAWLDRGYKHHVSTVNLYVEHKVCDSCYKLYSEVQKIVELQLRMATLTGVNVKQDNRNVVSITSVPAFKGESPQFGSRFQRVKYDKEMPDDWGLPLQSQVKVSLENQNSKMVSRCKFMIFVHGLRDIPKIFKQKGQNYYIRYKFFDQQVKYSLNLERTQGFQDMLKLKMDKIKIFYFFSESRQNIVQFIKNEEKLCIQLLEGNQVMGILELQLSDFKSDKVIKKDYYKMFSGPKVFPYLSWGLFVSLGLHEGDKIQASSLKLVSKQNLLLPEIGYHCPDLLPDEWIQMINEKPDVLASSQLIPADNQDYSLTNNSQILIKQKIEQELLDYSRRRVESHHKTKRRVYY